MKKIALFLVTALMCAGLIVSCGGGDDGPSSGTEYTVSFDTDGGTPATIASIKVEAGKTAGAAKWPADPTKGTDVFGGWFEGTTEYKYNTAINKDVALKAKWSEFTPPTRDEDYVTELGGFTLIGDLPSQKGWSSSGVDNVETDLDWDDVKFARYFVLHTRGGSGDDWEDGFGGLQVVMQGNGNGWGWGASQTAMNDVEFERGAAKDVFIVVDIRTIRTYNTFITGSQGKFLFCYYNGDNMNLGLGLQAGYITNLDLSELPDDAVEFEAGDANSEGVYGYVTAENILGLTLPTTFKTVTFDSDGGPTVDDVKVGTGKSMGVQYPHWVTKSGYIFLGWFDSADKKYDASTVIAGDVALTAKWEEKIYVPTLPKFTYLGERVGNAWEVDGDIIEGAKYLIIEAHAASLNGTGGLQFAYQSRTAGSTGGFGGWTNKNITGDWTDLTSLGSYGDEIDFYIVIDMSTIGDLADDAADGDLDLKLILNYPSNWVSSNFSVTAGFITDVALVKPTTNVTIEELDQDDGSVISGPYGWFAVNVPEGK